MSKGDRIMYVYIVADIYNHGGIIGVFSDEREAKKLAESAPEVYPIGGPYNVYCRRLEVKPQTSLEERLLLFLSEFELKDDE